MDGSAKRVESSDNANARNDTYDIGDQPVVPYRKRSGDGRR